MWKKAGLWSVCGVVYDTRLKDRRALQRGYHEFTERGRLVDWSAKRRALIACFIVLCSSKILTGVFQLL